MAAPDGIFLAIAAAAIVSAWVDINIECSIKRASTSAGIVARAAVSSFSFLTSATVTLMPSKAAVLMRLARLCFAALVSNFTGTKMCFVFGAKVKSQSRALGTLPLIWMPVRLPPGWTMLLIIPDLTGLKRAKTPGILFSLVISFTFRVAGVVTEKIRSTSSAIICCSALSTSLGSSNFLKETSQSFSLADSCMESINPCWMPWVPGLGLTTPIVNVFCSSGEWTGRKMKSVAARRPARIMKTDFFVIVHPFDLLSLKVPNTKWL